MKRKEQNLLGTGILLLMAFAIWTWLIQVVDVKPAPNTGTNVGFATFNLWFHQLTGVHMSLYVITDWLGLVPVFICLLFGFLGLTQLIKRKSLWKVDFDIIILGIYYIIVIFGYLIFEMIPINYRPILIEGFMEASYPSSTTLLVLSVMPTLIFQAKQRIRNNRLCEAICIMSYIFSAFMVIGRLVSGVHWFTDIVGSVMLSVGLFLIYKGIVLDSKSTYYKTGGFKWNFTKNFRN